MKYASLKILVRYLAYASLITPLVMFPTDFMFPFIVPKTVFFQSILFSAAMLAGCLVFIEKKHIHTVQQRKFWTPISVAVSLFWLSMLVSSLFGVDFQSSFWNNPERMLGLFTLSHYFILYFLFRHTFQTKEEWIGVVRVLVGVGVVAVMVGIVQRYINPEFLFNRGATRVVSTLGNPIYFAGFSMVVFFWGTYLTLSETTKLRWVYGSVAMLGVVGMVLANSRGTYVGVVIGLIAMLCSSLFFFKDNKKTRNIVVWLLTGLIVLSLFFFALRSNDLVKRVPVIGPLTSISFQEKTVRTRMLAAKIGLEAWKESPVLGWGMSNYYYAFNKYYEPEFLEFGYSETWFDNAHNSIVNTLVEQGVVGVVLYLALFVAVLYSLFGLYKRDNSSRIFCVIGIGFLFAHFFHNLFAFDSSTSYLYFFLFLAMVDVWYSRKGEGDDPMVSYGKNSVPPMILAVAVVLLVIVFYQVNVRTLMANNEGYHVRGTLRSGGNADVAMDRFDRALAWQSPYSLDIQWDFASDVLDTLPGYYYQGQNKSKELYDRAVESMSRFIATHPLDVRARLLYADLLRGGMVLYDLDLKAEAETQLSAAESLSPRRQEVEYSRVTFLAGTGDIQGSIDKANELISNNVDLIGPYIALGKVYYLSSQYHLIPEVMDRALRAGAFPHSVEQRIFMAQGYERQGRFRDALYWYDQAVRAGATEEVATKLEELSRLTKKPIPTALEDFFQIEIFEPVTEPDTEL